MNNNLDIGSFILQLLSLEILFKDFNNTDLMQELQKQDTQYFEKIIKNQEEILTLLRKEDNNAREFRKEKTEESIEKILKEGITTNNLDHLYKLTKINHIAKEEENMNNYGNYGNYGGRRAGYDSYGRGDYRGYDNYGRDEYGRRGYDMKYRGEEHIDRMGNEYGRYMESRERYGAGEETNKSFHYMIKSLEDFIKVLYEEADNEQQKQQLRETLQRSMM